MNNVAQYQSIKEKSGSRGHARTDTYSKEARSETQHREATAESDNKRTEKKRAR